MVFNLLLVKLGHGRRHLRLQHAPPEIPRRRSSVLRPQRQASRDQEEEWDARRSFEFPAKTKSDKSRECGTLFSRLFRDWSAASQEADDSQANVAAHRADAGEGEGGVRFCGGAGIPLADERVVTGQFGRQRQKLRDFVSTEVRNSRIMERNALL